MSKLSIFAEGNPHRAEVVHRDFDSIQSSLAAIGVAFERWEASRELDAHATQDEIIEAYREPIDRLMHRHGFKAVDVISMTADNPQKEAAREKFLHEHTHDDFEVHFFVEGEGVFYIRRDGKVYAMHCERGDLLLVPAHTAHWFDMGPEPNLKTIRLFVNPEGWVPNFTGDDIADRFPRLDTLDQAA